MSTAVRRSAVVALAFALLGAGCGRYLRAAAAVVDGRTISFAELNKAVDAVLKGAQDRPGGQDRLQAQREQLALIIQDRIIDAEAADRRIVIGAKTIDARFKEIRDQFQSEDQLRQALAQQGITLESLRDRIRLRLVAERIQKDLAEAVVVTDRDIREAYGRGERYDQFRARHILYPTDAKGLAAARDALRRIRAGADFAAIAKAESRDTGSAPRGGDLGLLTRGQLVPEFERAALALKKGQTSEPVKTQFGYHLIQLISRTRKTLKQVAPELRRQLEQQKGQEAFREFLSKRVGRAHIEINPRLGTFDAESLQVVDRKFYTPASPPAVPEGIPGLQLPGAEGAPG